MESIKETKELIVGLKETVKLGKKVRDIVSDGVDASDLPKTFALVKEQSEKVPVYSAAIEDVQKVRAELQDLDKNEIIEIVMSLVQAVSEVEAV